MDEDQIFAAQVRAARGLLSWSQAELAERCGLSRAVIARVEMDVTDARTSTVRAIRSAFSRAGVIFVDNQDGAFGVLLRL